MVTTNELWRVPTLRILYIGSKLTMCAIWGLTFSDLPPPIASFSGARQGTRATVSRRTGVTIMSVKSVFKVLRGRPDEMSKNSGALLASSEHFVMQTVQSSEPWWGALLTLARIRRRSIRLLSPYL